MTFYILDGNASGKEFSISFLRKQRQRQRHHEERNNISSFVSSITVAIILLLPDASLADPRLHIVNFTCGNHLGHNETIYAPNFSSTMSGQISTGIAVAARGSGVDASYGLVQCYGDLSSVDCALYFTQARTIVPRCHTFTGGRIYLDGCFMRHENYSFYQEYTGPNDHAICGNITRINYNSTFRGSARRALSRAVLAAPNYNGYARAHEAVSSGGNDSVYVLAECRKTLSASSCRACLENVHASLSGCCLPSSEGRALNTGCFMRYSDVDFLNPERGLSSIRVD